MKHLIFYLSILFLPVISFSQGVSFEQSEWKTVLAKAKSENKIIFMDAYTVWCGPCKMMSNQTFPNKEVGDFYNKNFVSVKMDMEKGEGIDLASKYKVNLYPTLLYIDGDGEIVHRTAGFMGPKEFIELGKIAVAPEKRLKGLEAKYNSGDRSPETLYAIAMAKSGAADPSAGTFANEYLKTQGDMGTDKNMELIMQVVNDPFSTGFQYLLKNKKQFEGKYGTQPVSAKVEQSFTEYLTTKPDMSEAEVEKLFTTVFQADGKRMASSYRITKAREAGDRAGFAKAAIAHYKKFPSNDADELNEIAWTFYKVVEDPKQLKSAVKLAKKSVSINDAFFNNDTLAALYFKLKKKKKAIKHATKAIEFAKAAGEDFSATQSLLDDIYKLK
jgi:thiol-disulfide isomerase/thioredoxin